MHGSTIQSRYKFPQNRLLAADRPRFSRLGNRSYRLLQRDDGQAINASEIVVAADQRGTEGDCRRGHPQIIFVQRKAALLASQLNGRVEIAGPLRDRFAADGSQELATGLLQLRASSARRKSCNPEKYFASNDRAFVSRR